MIDKDKIKKIADRDNYLENLKIFIPRALYVCTTGKFELIDILMTSFFLEATRKEIEIFGEERYNNLTQEYKNYFNIEIKNKNDDISIKTLELIKNIYSDVKCEEKIKSLEKIRDFVWGYLYTEKENIENIANNKNLENFFDDEKDAFLILKCFFACIICLIMQEIEIKIIEESN